MDIDLLHLINTERAARRAVLLVTNIESGAQRVVKAAAVAAETAWKVGLSCGGTIRVYVEKVS